MKYLVEYYCVENFEDSIDYFQSFDSLEHALNLVRFLLSISTSKKYYVISEISIVNDNLTTSLKKINMVRHSSQIFIYPADGNGAFSPIANGMKLESLIGSTLAGLMTLSDDYTNGLPLVRLRFGATTIVAHKRLHDIKVTLTTYFHV